MLLRLFKVLYVSAIILIAGFSWLWASSLAPHQIINTARVSCYNGISAPLEELGVYSRTSILPTEDRKLRVYCSGEPGSQTVKITNTLNEDTVIIDKANFPPLIPIDKNYTLSFTYIVTGSWLDVVQTFLLYFSLGFVALELLRRIILYVVQGKRFLS